MIILIETLIGVFFTLTIFYAKDYYGTKAVLMVIIVFIVAFALAVFFITEILKSVSKEDLTDENIADKPACQNNSYDRLKKKMKYRILSLSANALNKIVNFCTEDIDDEEDTGDLNE